VTRPAIDILQGIATRLGSTLATIPEQQATPELSFHSQGLRAGLRMAKETVEFEIEMLVILANVPTN
jgi:hypothetical protein